MSLQKFYKEKFNREKGKSSFSNMKMLPEVEHATEVNKNQSNVNKPPACLPLVPSEPNQLSQHRHNSDMLVNSILADTPGP